MKTQIVMAAALTAGQAEALTCHGTSPDWTLDLAAETAVFAFADRQSTLDIPQQSRPEGQDWPVAMTLIGPRDSAIVILEAPDESGTHAARILTQRFETPILLVGTCHE